jgi:hypothetical protein
LSKVSVKVLGAVVDGAQSGDVIQIDKASAQHLQSIGYVEILSEAKPEKAAESAPKPTATPNKSRRGQEKK